MASQVVHVIDCLIGEAHGAHVAGEIDLKHLILRANSISWPPFHHLCQDEDGDVVVGGVFAGESGVNFVVGHLERDAGAVVQLGDSQTNQVALIRIDW